MAIVKGAILEKGEEYYTHFKKIFKALGNFQKNYNWLITDCEACPQSSKHRERLYQSHNHAWISGKELTGIIEKDDFQWIWAVLSGFENQYSHEEVLKYPLPYADGYSGFWNNNISIQHPLATVELVAWDSSLTLFFSREEYLFDKFMKAFPLAEDLEKYNLKKDDVEAYNMWI